MLKVRFFLTNTLTHTLTHAISRVAFVHKKETTQKRRQAQKQRQPKNWKLPLNEKVVKTLNKTYSPLPLKTIANTFCRTIFSLQWLSALAMFNLFFFLIHIKSLIGQYNTKERDYLISNKIFLILICSIKVFL